MDQVNVEKGLVTFAVLDGIEFEHIQRIKLVDTEIQISRHSLSHTVPQRDPPAVLTAFSISQKCTTE